MANEIKQLHSDQTEPGPDEHLPKHMLSLLEYHAYSEGIKATHWGFGGVYGPKTITDYHDNRVGHIKPKRSNAANWRDLRKNGENMLKKDRKQVFNDENKVKQTETEQSSKLVGGKRSQHNKHFRGIQRKDQTVKTHKWKGKTEE